MGTSEHSVTGLPTGTWRIDTGTSEMLFSARTFWGLMRVHGRFGEFDGELRIEGADASGTLALQTASLDTGNAKRDEHLRSVDFLDAERHPTITFTLDGAEAEHGHVHLHGTLALPHGPLPLTLHTDVVTSADGLELRAGTAISRTQAHLSAGPLGMIRDELILIADLHFRPE
jgi:polyisoprenoid-binding protein YceI